MMPRAAALALVPGLGQGAAPLHLQRLAGGHINETWRVDTSLGQYTLRLDGPAAMRPGVARNRELLLHAAAAAAGLAPPIVCAVPAAQLLVCQYLQGRTWNDADFQDPAALQRLGERLQLLHGLSPPAALEARFDPHALTLRLSVNGELRQNGSSADMIHRVPRIISHVSAIFTLEPGDVILTGTPAGVGQVVAGDVMEAEIEGVGRLRIGVQ